MESILKQYSSIYEKIKIIKNQIEKEEKQILDINDKNDADIVYKIEELLTLLKKIDEYILIVKGFQEQAKKNLESQNVLTIKAPPGYRVNLNRLRNWAMMINPMASNDPYAQRVLVVSKCDELFLEEKKKKFLSQIAQLKGDKTRDIREKVAVIESRINELKQKLKIYAMSSEMEAFATNVIRANSEYWNTVSPEVYNSGHLFSDFYSPGAYSVPLGFDKDDCEKLKTKLGSFIDVEGANLLLPVEFPSNKEFAIRISCAPARSRELDRGLQNLVLSMIDGDPAGLRKIYVLDGARFNSSSMGSLRKLEDTFAMSKIPRNPEQLTSTLEEILSSFSDIDEILDLYDSVEEYNSEPDNKNKLPRTTLILYGWPKSFEGNDKKMIQRIMTNYERYGVSFITISYRNEDKKEQDNDSMPEYAYQNSVHISMYNKRTSITFPDSEPQKFVLYPFKSELSDKYVESLKASSVKKETIGNEYTKRYSMTEIEPYTRSYKKLELPFGIDGKDKDYTISFENENFATYLVGASRSGKSTLIHTLIAGIIRNYHPDNVELWLADFKQLEFKRYIKHLPPHVKYVLLDESTELVFDLIDKLTAEMLERQKLFSRLGKQRIDQIDPVSLSEPLPLIFVILDEFSIMSQSIEEYPEYRLKLQNLLAKGAALGIRFLFSSQTFTSGVRGLTPTARAQIQQRISMKGSKEEITETLELSSNLKTEQVLNWIDALPPHYALVKFRTDADSLPQVKRFLVMYFENYDVRDALIEKISQSMHAVDEYRPDDISAYKSKKPVLIDGNSFDKFDIINLSSEIMNSHRNSGVISLGDEIFVSFGTPRLMTKVKMTAISSETRENILLLSRSAENSCAASIMLSSILSFKSQKAKVKIWAYPKNRLYQAYKHVFVSENIEIIEGFDAISEDIRRLKQHIKDGIASKELIVMIGMDRICMDFDFVDMGTTDNHDNKSSLMNLKKIFEANGAVATTEKDKEKGKAAGNWGLRKNRLKKELIKEGKSEDEIRLILEEEYRKFKEGQFEITGDFSVANNTESQIQSVFETQNTQSLEKVKNNKPYNAKEDFVYLLKQGSRMGYHFLLSLNNYSDLKQTGLKKDYFRYKLTFQLSTEDSRDFYGNKSATTLPEHICQYSDGLDTYSFRPYLHKGIGWDGWEVDVHGNVINPYGELDV